MTFLCISFYFKGGEFLKACKEAGNKVYLVTAKSLEHEPWPREYLDDIFFIQADEDGNFPVTDLKAGLAWFIRENKIDRIVALDDFDVEKGAEMREHFRIPGMGQTTARYFRDKLAMRIQARDAGIRIPDFTPLFNNQEVQDFVDRVTFPVVIKPRGEASATGIKKVHNAHEFWEAVNGLGENRDNFLAERFMPGDVYHVDGLTYQSKVLFAKASGYLNTPFEVAHGGGIFRSATLPYNSADEKALLKANKDVMKAFGMVSCASHTEFIKAHADGEFYFLETAARVGGAHIAEMVEAASGVNLWAEWAKMESALLREETYKAPKAEKKYAGVVISLARDKHPDTSHIQTEEIYWRLQKEHHIGFIFKSGKRERILQLLDEYASLIRTQYHASAPPPESMPH